MRKAALVYQNGIANVFNTTPKRCDKCQDRPGRDGLGKVCGGCQGLGTVPSSPKRLYQGAFRDCEFFLKGMTAAGYDTSIWHCDEPGDITDATWKPGIGVKHYMDKAQS